MSTPVEPAARDDHAPDLATAEPPEATPADPVPSVSEEGRGAPSRRGTILRVVGGVVIALVVFAVLRSRFPDPQQFFDALGAANWWWVLAAFSLEIASIGMLIRQQRRLMRAFGVPISYGRMGAIAYSSTAISMSIPAGGAVSAGYSYRKFRTAGASASTAASVLLLSGVFSVVALVLLYLVGAVLATTTRLSNVGGEYPVLTLLIGVVVVGAVWFAIWWITRRSGPPVTAATPRLDRYEERHRWLGAAGRHALEAFRRAERVPRKDWNLALTQSVANWLLDALSLYAATRAFDLSVDLWALALLYLGIQVVRQIPVTPGGIGIVEASLLAGLVSAGADTGAAAAAVVIYRLFSCWLLIPAGFGIMAGVSFRDGRKERKREQAAAAGESTPAVG